MGFWCNNFNLIGLVVLPDYGLFFALVMLLAQGHLQKHVSLTTDHGGVIDNEVSVPNELPTTLLKDRLCFWRWKPPEALIRENHEVFGGPLLRRFHGYGCIYNFRKLPNPCHEIVRGGVWPEKRETAKKGKWNQVRFGNLGNIFFTGKSRVTKWIIR